MSEDPATRRLVVRCHASNFAVTTQPCVCRADIDFCFGGKQSVEEIYAELERSGGQWGIDTIALMSK